MLIISAVIIPHSTGKSIVFMANPFEILMETEEIERMNVHTQEGKRIAHIFSLEFFTNR